MAFALVSQTNLCYNDALEGLPGDQLARVGLSQGFAGDAAVKAFAAWRDPQFRFVFTTTTATDTGASTLNMVTSTRSVNDPQSSPSNQITKTLGPLAGVLTAGTVRPFRCRVKQQIASGAVNVFWFAGTVQGAATPVVAQPAVASLAQLGTKRPAGAADDNVVLTAAAGSLVVTITHGTGNAALTWTVDVFFDDQI